jgi:hypothetical protein
VKLSELLLPTTIEVGVKDLAIVGGSTTNSVSEAGPPGGTPICANLVEKDSFYQIVMRFSCVVDAGFVHRCWLTERL